MLDEDCGEPAITAPGLNQDLTIYVNWGESDEVTNRTYIFMIVYAAISALWIVTSLLVITTICGPVTKVVRGLCFWPWFLVIIAGSVLDAVATGYHIHDIVHTTVRILNNCFSCDLILFIILSLSLTLSLSLYSTES